MNVKDLDDKENIFFLSRTRYCYYQYGLLILKDKKKKKLDPAS